MAKQKNPPFLLTVLSGPNAGAELGISGGRTSVGGHRRQDIQLDGLPDKAMKFVIERDMLLLRPLKGSEIATRDGTILRPSRTVKLPLPAQLTVNGNTTLHICKLHQEKSFFARRAKVLVASAAIIGLSSFWLSTLVSTSSLATAAIAPEPHLPDTPIAAPDPDAQCGGSCVETAAAAFRDLLIEAGLLDVVVTPSGDILRIKVSSAARNDPAWAAVRTAYDQKWSMRVPLLLERAKPALEIPFAIKAVWLGQSAEVTTQDGAVYRVGSTVPGGWTIEAIRSGSVDLRSGDTQIRIDF